jgi:hypothetical protein
MASFLKFKSFWVHLLWGALLMASLGCSYKPSYLQKSAGTGTPQRWKVNEIDPSRLSPDETTAFERMGSPQYIRFFRKLDPDRERVYEWIYTEPVLLISFVDGKQVDYLVVDDNPSPLNDYQRKWLFWGGVTAGIVGGLILLYSLFVK